jgi:hypothetical protein
LVVVFDGGGVIQWETDVACRLPLTSCRLPVVCQLRDRGSGIGFKNKPDIFPFAVVKCIYNIWKDLFHRKSIIPLRFPKDFMFELSESEWIKFKKSGYYGENESLRSQFVTLKNGKRGQHRSASKYLEAANRERLPARSFPPWIQGGWGVQIRHPSISKFKTLNWALTTASPPQSQVNTHGRQA